MSLICTVSSSVGVAGPFVLEAVSEAPSRMLRGPPFARMAEIEILDLSEPLLAKGEEDDDEPLAIGGGVDISDREKELWVRSLSWDWRVVGDLSGDGGLREEESSP